MTEPSSDDDTRRERRRNRMGVAIIGLHDDHDAIDRAYFDGLSHGEKMSMIGTMFAEQWLMKGGDAGQLRLRRDVVRLQRRGG